MDWHYQNTFQVVPGNRPDMFSSFLNARDVMVVDLADTVPMNDKAYARDEVRHWLKWNRQWKSELLMSGRLMVGINDFNSAPFKADVRLLQTVRPSGIFLNGISFADQVISAAALLLVKDQPAPFMVSVIGSAMGLSNLDEIAQCPSVGRLAFDVQKYRIERDNNFMADNTNEAMTLFTKVSKSYGLPNPLIRLPCTDFYCDYESSPLQ